MGKSQYIKPNKFNPIVIAKKLEETQKKIEHIEAVNKQKYRALEDFTALLMNFASHDIKNAVHTMDGTVSTISVENLTQSDIDGLKICISNIRAVLDNFGKLDLEKKLASFTIPQIFQSIEVLYRPGLRETKTQFIVEHYPQQSTTDLVYGFHPFLQLFNNLMMNSMTALEKIQEKKIKIKILEDDEIIRILFADNGSGINQDDRSKIFNPYFTTKSGGTGVGLSHAKYVTDEYKGTIQLLSENEEGYTTTFQVELIKKHHSHESQNTNN